ncbi:MAG: glycosyltransferase family 2 protein [Bacteroidales bacterium]|nr:glycosyltransferase family 2 protein [Bacteroidales bacterium]
MISTKTLTLIIPTYNMQAYLKRCLDSLIVEDELMAKFEVLVVNDGSKDDSSEIAQQYERRYPQTFRVIDKENGNYGSCVNRGLSEAKGAFIKLLDADDWFDTDQFVKYLHRLGQTTDPVDLVLTDFTKIDETGCILGKGKYTIPYDNLFSFQDYEGMEYFAHHSLTYRTGLLIDCQFHQTEGISYTDTEWVYYPQLYVKNCVYWDIDLYRYLLGREGQTMDPKVQLKRSSHMITILKRMITTAISFENQGGIGMGHKRLSSFIQHACKGIYYSFLVKSPKSDFHSDVLRGFDCFLFANDRPLYDIIGNESVLKGIPVHYVKFWRRFGKRFPIDFFRSFYRTVKYGNR